MPAVSKKQRQTMAIAEQVKKGNMKPSPEPPPLRWPKA